jgi:hypothetical protein
MHRTLRKGLAVVGASAAIMMVCGFGQASAAEAAPAQHGSAHMTSTTADVTAAGGADIVIDLGLGFPVNIGAAVVLDIGSILNGCGCTGAGSADNHK